MTSCDNICEIKEVLDRFVKKTLNFIKAQESELMGLKNKVTKDLQS